MKYAKPKAAAIVPRSSALPPPTSASSWGNMGKIIPNPVVAIAFASASEINNDFWGLVVLSIILNWWEN